MGVKCKCSRYALRCSAAAVCTASILLFAPTRARAQSKLDRIEWFVESGESFQSLGHQSGTYQVPETLGSYGESYAPFDATVVSPSRFSRAENPAVLAGPQFILTPRDSIQFAYSDTINTYFLQPVGGALAGSVFHRGPGLSLN